MNRTLYIISVYRPDLLEEFVHAMGVSRNSEVIMDRRVGERRYRDRAESEESRRLERRVHHVDETLRKDGFAVVRVSDAEPALTP